MMFYTSAKIESSLESFKRSCSPEDYGVVYEFATDLLSNGLSEIRIAGYIKWLKIIVKTRGKKLTEFDKDDVKYVMNHFQIRCNRGEISQSTVFEVKKTLKKFFKWYDKGELETLEEIETPEVREIPKVEVKPERTPTPEEGRLQSLTVDISPSSVKANSRDTIKLKLKVD